MPDFQYSAQSLTGSANAGTINATSRLEAIRLLQEKRLVPVELKEIQNSAPWQRRIPRAAVANCFAGIADLLESGMPLLKALDVISTQLAHPSLRQSLRELRDEVADGSTLADAMRRYPHVFNELSASMIAVGEEGGFLESALQRVARLTERQEELRGRLLSALAYPAFLLSVGFLVGVGMLIYFVPLFEPLFERMRERGELPLATVTLLAVSAKARAMWPLLALGSILIGLLVHSWSRSEQGTRALDLWRLRVYGLGPVMCDLTMSRFFHVLGTLLSNGVPMLRSLQMAEKATGNRAVAEAIDRAAQEVASGGTLAVPLSQSGLFPLDVTEMIAIGEQSNRLEQVLLGLADKLERRAQKKLDLLTKLLEPVLMTVLAAMIGFLIMALLLPIFTSSGKFN